MSALFQACNIVLNCSSGGSVGARNVCRFMLLSPLICKMIICKGVLQVQER